MATTTIATDLEWKRQIIGLDAPDLSLCYQCGTCTAVCPVSTEDNPFPRKEMVWVQWGLKARALGNSSIWLCHQCGSCNAYCPRDAKPSNVMAALRDYSIGHYAVPRFMGHALQDPRYLPLLFAVPVLVFLAILGWLGHLRALPEGPIVFSKFIPIPFIEVTFVGFIALAAIGAAMGGARYWRAMGASASADGSGRGPALLPTLSEILKHRRFAICDENRAGNRTTRKEHLHHTHLAVFYGFLGLVVTTVSVGIGIYAFGYVTPWPLWHPVKILGNLSGLAVIAAVIVFSLRRIADARQAGKSTYSDWLLLSALGLTALTGFLCEGLRLAGWRIAYPMYVVHLAFIFFLLVYIPYSKFAHLVYRSLAMLHAAGLRRAP